jgi:type I restriction enzyme M protein
VVGGKPNTDLIPPEVMVSRFFADTKNEILEIEVSRDALVQEMEELDEEHGGDDGLLAEARNDKGKLTKSGVKARIAEIRKDPDCTKELKVLNRYLALIEKEALLAKQIKEAQKALDAQVLARYESLSTKDVQSLVIQEKWIAAISAAMQGDLDTVSQTLTSRVKMLAERYAEPLPEIIEEVEDLSLKVDEHLKRMGFEV